MPSFSPSFLSPPPQHCMDAELDAVMPKRCWKCSSWVLSEDQPKFECAHALCGECAPKTLLCGMCHPPNAALRWCSNVHCLNLFSGLESTCGRCYQAQPKPKLPPPLSDAGKLIKKRLVYFALYVQCKNPSAQHKAAMSARLDYCIADAVGKKQSLLVLLYKGTKRVLEDTRDPAAIGLSQRMAFLKMAFQSSANGAEYADKVVDLYPTIEAIAQDVVAHHAATSVFRLEMHLDTKAASDLVDALKSKPDIRALGDGFLPLKRFPGIVRLGLQVLHK
jgi:hypothetical protein